MKALYLLNMSKAELVQYLHDCGVDPETNNFEGMSKRELIAHLYECYRPEMLEVCSAEQCAAQ